MTFDCRCLTVLIVAVTVAELSCAKAQEITVRQLRSVRQSSATIVRVLEPDRLKPGADYPVVYVLPVEPHQEQRWGNSEQEVIKHDLHNRHQLIFVFPTFSQLPWYADHPTDRERQQESYFLQDVIPLVEKHHPVSRDRCGRLLAGFSKSGWGAWSLILRNPGIFHAAAAFDAPMMMSEAGKYGSGPAFGTPQNFQQYQISRLLKALKAPQQRSLALIGKGNFHQQHRQVAELARQLQVPVYVDNNAVRQHSWHSGWLPVAVEWLAGQLPER